MASSSTPNGSFPVILRDIDIALIPSARASRVLGICFFAAMPRTSAATISAYRSPSLMLTASTVMRSAYDTRGS